MRLDNLINLTDGVLLNTPSINQIESFCFEPQNATRGALYFDTNRVQESIEIAIKNGAYAIIVDSDCSVSDSEIAWIKVENIQNALIMMIT